MTIAMWESYKVGISILAKTELGNFDFHQACRTAPIRLALLT
jgi:hypothetical protein